MMPPPPPAAASTSNQQPHKQPSIKGKNAVGTKSSDKVPVKRKSTAAKKKPHATTRVASSSTAAAKQAAATAAAMSPPATASQGNRAADGTLKIPSPELAKQLQKLYVVPPNNGDGANGGEPPQPQYITQGDLIDQVINDYTKSHNGGTKERDKAKEKDEEKKK